MQTPTKKPLSSWNIPLLLLLLCAISYSLLSPWLGFHWDDWLQLLVHNHLGNNAFWAYFAFDRPTSAWTHILLFPILGENPFHWQLFTMLMRWLAAVSLWWGFSNLWPSQRRQAVMAAMLFAVYPLFTQQAISLAYHQHLLQYALFAFSLAAMVKAQRAPGRFWLFTGLAVLAEVLQLSITEFYSGVDLIRPVLLWIIFREDAASRRGCWWKTLFHWSPYLLLLAAYTFWRLFIVEFPVPEPHALQLVSTLRSAPLQGLAQLVRFALTDSLYTLLGSWDGAIGLGLNQTVTGMTMLSWGIGLAAGALVVFFFRFLPEEETPKNNAVQTNWTAQAAIVGALATLLGPLPIWLTGAQAIGDVHANRFALASMFGASLLITALIEWTTRSKQLSKAILLAALVGLSVSFHMRVSEQYRVEQARLRSFFWQLEWRAPHLEPQTALIARDETYPAQLSTVAAALNLAYPAPQREPQNLSYWAYRVQTDADPAASLPGSFENQYRILFFRADAENSLVLHWKNDLTACLWVLREIDQHNPEVPENILSFLPLSNLERIQNQPQQPEYPPAMFFGNPPANEWCQLFQQAELAVQNSDWEIMASHLAALEKRGSQPQPDNIREWLPFIEGYAHTGQWETALDLTLETARLSPDHVPMLCALWEDIVRQTTAAPQQSAALEDAQHTLGCSTVTP